MRGRAERRGGMQRRKWEERAFATEESRRQRFSEAFVFPWFLFMQRRRRRRRRWWILHTVGMGQTTAVRIRRVIHYIHSQKLSGHFTQRPTASRRRRLAVADAAATNTASQALSEAPPPGHDPTRHPVSLFPNPPKPVLSFHTSSSFLNSSNVAT